jgi:hypothetical protein
MLASPASFTCDISLVATRAAAEEMAAHSCPSLPECLVRCASRIVALAYTKT